MALSDGAVEAFADDTGVVGIYPWHRWFAWYPVWSPADGWLWLVGVERRYSVKYWKIGKMTTVRTIRRARSSGIEVREIEDTEQTQRRT